MCKSLDNLEVISHLESSIYTACLIQVDFPLGFLSSLDSHLSASTYDQLKVVVIRFVKFLILELLCTNLVKG